MSMNGFIYSMLLMALGGVLLYAACLFLQIWPSKNRPTVRMSFLYSALCAVAGVLFGLAIEQVDSKVPFSLRSAVARPASIEQIEVNPSEWAFYVKHTPLPDGSKLRVAIAVLKAGMDRGDAGLIEVGTKIGSQVIEKQMQADKNRKMYSDLLTVAGRTDGGAEDLKSPEMKKLALMMRTAWDAEIKRNAVESRTR